MLSWGGNKVYIIPTHERPDRQIWDLTWWIDVITIRCVLDIHRHMCMLWVPAIFNDAALLSWPWVLLVDTVVPCENHWYAATHEQIVLHTFVFSTPPTAEKRTQIFSGKWYWLYMQMSYNYPTTTPRYSRGYNKARYRGTVNSRSIQYDLAYYRNYNFIIWII